MLPLQCAFSARFVSLIFFLIIAFGASIGNLQASAWLQEETTPIATAEESNKDKKPKIGFERLLIPVQDLGSALTTLPGAGLISYDEFVEFLAQKQKTLVKPPVPSVVQQASHVATVGEKLVTIQSTLKIRALEEKWSLATISLGTAALGEWTSDNKDAFLYASGDGSYIFAMPKPGEYSLTLTMEVPVDATPEGNQATLTIPAVALSTLKAELKQANATIELLRPGQSQPLAKQVGTTENPSVSISANLGAVSGLLLRWYPTTQEKMADELLLHAQKWLKLHVEDRQLQSDGYFEFEVLKGKVKQLEILLPKGDRVLDLSSSGKISDWTVEDGEDAQKLIVKLYEEVSGKVTLDIHTERDFAIPEDGSPAELSIASGPDVTPISVMKSAQAAREVGQLILSTSTDLEINVQQEQGLSRIVPTEVNQRVAFSNGLAYRFYASTFQLTATVRPITPKVTSQQMTVALLTSDQIFLESILNMTIERAGIFTVTVQVPVGAEQIEVNGPNVSQHRVQAETNTVQIDLKQKTQGTFAIQLSCVVPVSKETPTTELPLFLVDGTERSTGMIDVVATTDLEVITDPQAVVSARTRQTPMGFPGEYQSGEFRKLLSRVQPVSSWQYQQQPVTIPLALKVRPARLSAGLAHHVQIREELIDLSTTVSYYVEFAQLDTFRFKVPASYAQKVQIELVEPKETAIKQKTSSEPDADNWVTWTVVLQRPVMGNVTLVAKAFLPLDDGAANADDQNTAAPATAPAGADMNGQLNLLLPRPLGLEEAAGQTATPLTQIQGEVSLEKTRSLSVTAKSSAPNLEAIDVRELTRLPKSGIAAYRYVETVDSEPISLELSVSKSEIQEVIKTVIPRALVEIVTNQEPVAMLRFRAQILTSERQRLVLAMPKNSVSLGVWIDGKQAALEKSQIPATDLHEYYYVSVARQKAADEPFSLAMICRWPLSAAPYNAWGGGFRFPLPLLGQESDLNLAVQQLRVAIWTPRDHVLIGTPNGFRPTVEKPVIAGLTAPLLRADDRVDPFNSWIGNSATGIVEFPVEGRVHDWSKLGSANEITAAWWSVIPFTAVISGAIVVIAVLLLKAPWAYRLTLLLLVAFGMSLLALNDPNKVYHLLQLSRYGLLTLAGIWIVGLVGLVSKLPSKPSPTRRTEPPHSKPTTPPDVTPPTDQAGDPPPSNLP
ncbi:hypothetical protein [Lacunimicrobium album]